MSCCGATRGYRDELIADLNLLGTNDFVELGAYAVPGVTTATAASAMPSFLAGFVEAEKAPSHVLINLGSNDVSGVQDGSIPGATWTANLASILDAVHAKWPSALVYAMRVYHSGYTSGQNTIDDTLIPNALAGRGAWAFVGPDERTFLPGNVTDTTHPTAAGYDLTAAEWQTVMGY